MSLCLRGFTDIALQRLFLVLITNVKWPMFFHNNIVLTGFFANSRQPINYEFNRYNHIPIPSAKVTQSAKTRI